MNYSTVVAASRLELDLALSERGLLLVQREGGVSGAVHGLSFREFRACDGCH